MSDDWVKFVSVDPNWVPTRDAIERATQVMARRFPHCRNIDFDLNEEVVLFDAGANTTSITCPHCGKDAYPWWGDAMDQAYKTKFADLSITAPCCGQATSLNSLVYDGPAGFGRFALNVMNANTPDNAPADMIAELEAIFGTRLKVIWRHL